MRISNNTSPYFKSNYNFNLTSKNSKQATKALEKLYKIENPRLQVFENYTKSPKLIESGLYEKINICADDCYDKYIESVLKAKQVEYQKSTKEEALDIDSIFLRIGFDKDSYFGDVELYILDVDKVEKLFKQNKGFYVSYHGGENAAEEKYQNFISYLKTGQEIEAPRVEIKDKGDFVKLDFIDGRHRFSVLRDMGMDRMPFILNKSSYEAAQKYGLLS